MGAKIKNKKKWQPFFGIGGCRPWEMGGEIGEKGKWMGGGGGQRKFSWGRKRRMGGKKGKENKIK